MFFLGGEFLYEICNMHQNKVYASMKSTLVSVPDLAKRYIWSSLVAYGGLDTGIIWEDIGNGLAAGSAYI